MTDIPRQKSSMTGHMCKSVSMNTMTDNIYQGCRTDPNANIESSGSIHIIKSRHQNIDFASGDHRKSSLKDFSKQQVGDYKTEVKYKNVNFKESYSDIEDEQDAATFRTTKYGEKDANTTGDVTLMQRPITCPITECGKIVAVDSVSLHFYFDHSKIPRIPISSGASTEIHLKVSQISSKTRCFAVLSLKTQNKLSKEEPPPLLLMGAKYCINASATKSLGTHKFSSKEVLVLWICKVADITHNYSITIAREDRRLGHSYIGEPIHMKDNQDVKFIFSKAECLIVTGKAVDKILETQDHLIVFVHILI